MSDANPAAPAPHFRETKAHDQDTLWSLTYRPRKSWPPRSANLAFIATGAPRYPIAEMPPKPPPRCL